jgi:hypothetical protein
MHGDTNVTDTILSDKTSFSLSLTSSALHSYRIIPLLEESGIDKGIGEHEQERQDIYGAGGNTGELITSRMSCVSINEIEETKDI